MTALALGARVAAVRRRGAFKTLGAGVWQLGGVVDYAATLCLARPVSTTNTWRDVVIAIETARDRAGELRGRPLVEDLTDPHTGEITPVIVVSDNSAGERAAGFARHIAARPEFRHVRTRYQGFLEAAEGTRTLDLLHGKQTL